MSAAHDHVPVVPTPVRPKGRRNIAALVGARQHEARRSKFDAQKDHLNETPRETSGHLIDLEPFRGMIWEPACGKGALARPLMDAGYSVIATDIAAYGFGTAGRDFLRSASALAPNIVTNPPFDHQGGEAFARHALGLLSRVPSDPARYTRKLVLLHRARWLETPARDDIFEDRRFVRQIVLARERQPMMHRDGYDGPKLKKSPEMYAWFVWDLDNPRAAGQRWYETVRV